jgi:WD40 repeat protein
VTAVAFDPAGSRLVSVGWGPEAKVWDLTRPQEGIGVGQPRKDEKRRIENFAFSPDGRTVVAVRVPGGDVERWDPATGDHTRLTNLGLFDRPGDMVIPGRMAAVSADCRRVIGATPSRLRIWTAGTAGPVNGPSLDSPIGFVALSADGSRMAAAAGVGEGPPPLGIDAVVWDTTTGAEVCRVPLPGERCTALALSADGRQLLLGTAGPETEPRVRVWDVEAGRETLAVPCGAVAWGLALDRERRRLAACTGGPQPRIVVWDSHTGQVLRAMPCLDEYFDLAFAPDGRRLAGVSRQVMTLWDPAEGDEVMTLRGQPRTGNDPPFNPRVAFDSTGRQLGAVQADKTVMIWTAATRPKPGSTAGR